MNIPPGPSPPTGDILFIDRPTKIALHRALKIANFAVYICEIFPGVHGNVPGNIYINSCR